MVSGEVGSKYVRCPICQSNFVKDEICDTYCPICTEYLQGNAFGIWNIKQERGEIK